MFFVFFGFFLLVWMARGSRGLFRCWCSRVGGVVMYWDYFVNDIRVEV